MKIYDISQELLSCRVYPGDPSPHSEKICDMNRGDLYNLTAFSMCAHNGTHLDAPSHFLLKGDTVESLPLSKTVGYAYVADCKGELNAADAETILSRAKEINPDAAKRILIRGEATVTSAAACVFASAGLELVGNESQTVGPEDAPMDVHRILLSSGVVLLEGIRLDRVREGVYFLSAAPLAIAGSDGSPCRALLIEF